MSTAATAANENRAVSRRRRHLDTLGGWMFLGPAVVFILMYFGFPLVSNTAMSMQNYTPSSFYSGEAPFVGLSNYKEIIGSDLFWPAIRNTVVFTICSITFQFGIGLGLSLFFSRKFPLSGLLRALILLPWLLPLIVSGAVWRWMFDQDLGIINYALGLVGVDSLPWLTQPGWALAALIITNIWIGIPFNFILLHGGLQGIPDELYEAAELDGAGAFARFRTITWPLLKPVSSVALLLGLVYTIKVFDVIMVITGGGPANSTQTLTTWSYQLSFELFKFGPGAAVSTLLVGVAAVIGIGYVIILRRQAQMEG